MTDTSLIPECGSCKYAGCDPDGTYCGHPESFKQTMFGRGFIMMRNDFAHPDTAVCGMEGKLWEEKK
jgi:hypothetical protein